MLCDLFAKRFFRADPGILGEYFTATLAPAPGIAGQIVEPGHHYEWVWLLRRYERAGGQPMQLYVDALYAHAARFGFDEEGLIVDELLVDGSPHRRSRRIWPIAEAIKANLVEARLGRPGAATRAASLAGLMRARFLATDPVGGWLDRLDAAGSCTTDFMPASTLYHLVGAVAELLLNEDGPGRAATGSDPESATRCRVPDRSTAG